MADKFEPIKYGKEYKKISFYDSDKRHADLRIRLQLHSENAKYITNDKKNILRGLMWKNFVHIKIEENDNIGRDEFRFIRSKTGKDITDEMSLDKDSSMT